jgi:hypothetical protein
VFLGDVVTKYVREDGTLADDKADPALKKSWKPKIADEILTCKHVRMLPFTARDIWEAEGLLIGKMVPLGVLKAQLPKLADLSPEELQRVATARPPHTKDLLPLARRNESGASTVTDETLVFVLRRYHRQCFAYPDGFHGLVLGTDYLYERGPWRDQKRGRAKDLPVTQFKQYQDGESGENPYGTGLMTFIGPLLEARAVLRGTLADHADKFRKRKTFIPTTSTLRPEQMMADAATYLPVMPGQEPKYEELPDFPEAIVKMDAELRDEVTDVSGLQAAAQGHTVPNTKSGLHYQVQVEQTIVGLSDLKGNIDRGLSRGWRIILQLLSEFETSQKVQWVGDDGAYKEKEWSGADFGNTSDVRVSKGSFTGLAPSSKAALTQSMQAAGLLTLEQTQRAIRGQVGGLIALQDNPHEMRVKRQVSAWQDGPPEGWVPQPPPMDPATGQPPVDPNTGQPLPVPPDPTLAQLFAPLPCDDDPTVARLRLFELGEGMASTKYTKKPPAWRVGYDAEYARARAAAQVLDAAAVAKLQQDAQTQGQKLQQTEAKLAEKPSISLGLDAGFKLDQVQVGTILAAQGIQLPPGGIVEPQLDPNMEMQTQAQVQTRQIGADVEKHRTTESAKIERERIHAGADVAKAQADVAKAQGAPVAAPQPIAIHVPGVSEQAAVIARIKATLDTLQASVQEVAQRPRPRKFKAVRDPAGKLDSIVAVDE